MKIESAGINDIPALLRLQHMAYQSEAELLDDLSIQPLRETPDDLHCQLETGTVIYKMTTAEGEIIGSVRGKADGCTFFIGKLMVNPLYQNKGYGKRLLAHIENTASDAITRFELFTSNLSSRNLELYTSRGYIPFREEEATSTFWKFIFLEKLSG